MLNNEIATNVFSSFARSMSIAWHAIHPSPPLDFFPAHASYCSDQCVVVWRCNMCESIQSAGHQCQSKWWTGSPGQPENGWRIISSVKHTLLVSCHRVFRVGSNFWSAISHQSKYKQYSARRSVPSTAAAPPAPPRRPPPARCRSVLPPASPPPALLGCRCSRPAGRGARGEASWAHHAATLPPCNHQGM